jgi:LPXTG-motif cell wall-anchored protein
MPNTGGAPLLMALAGSLTAGSALLLRRKLN